MIFQKTMMKNSTFILISALVSVLILGILWLNGNGYFKPKEGNVKPDTVFHTDTLWQDTVITNTVIKPVPKIIEKIKTVTVTDSSGNVFELASERKVFNETFASDNDTCEVGVYTTGINTVLDSITLNHKKHEKVITNTIEITKYKEKKKTFLDRFHISIQAGYGYGFNYKGFEPYVGIGGSFDL